MLLVLAALLALLRFRVGTIPVILGCGGRIGLSAGDVMKQTPEWNTEALLQSPLFAPLHPILAELDPKVSPRWKIAMRFLRHGIRPSPCRAESRCALCAQQRGKLPFEAQYEPRCYLSGEVQMRAHNWHDLLNALVWLTFPKTKAVLNARHYHALIEEKASGHTRRGAVRDVNTLLDESGVIVAYADAELARLLRNFKWKELFWQRRERVMAGMGFYLLGHGLYEKALLPYVGLTGQGLLVKVEQQFFSRPLDAAIEASGQSIGGPSFHAGKLPQHPRSLPGAFARCAGMGCGQRPCRHITTTLRIFVPAGEYKYPR